MHKPFSSVGGLDSTGISTVFGSGPSYIKPGQRFDLLDVCKGIAACIIVVHHLFEYSPTSDLADQFAPNVLYGIYYYGLFVVHLFLVFGGFALAMTTPDRPISWNNAFSLFGARYLRLAPAYLVMVFLLVTASWVLGGRMNPPLIESFSWWQLLAHVFFLQDLLGFGNLSAGTWYLCIDLQYVALFVLIQALLQTVGKIVKQDFGGPVAMSIILFPLGLISVWSWSRVLENDIYVFFFLGSLVLGTLVGWTLQGRIPWLVFPIYALAMTASLAIDFRPRILVAIGASFVIYVGLRFWPRMSWPRPLLWLGKVSYSLFLIHYLANGLVLHGLNPWIGSSPFRAFASMVVAFFVSLTTAAALYYWVEFPCHRWMKARGADNRGKHHHSTMNPRSQS